jgi:4-diphosphocytidyl-2-C-methyl-D-erythritol kinase
MIVFPNAKINLGLHVTGKRPDGFHNLETVFYPIALHDALEINPASDGKTIFTTSGLPIPGEPESNLCIQAYNLLKSAISHPSSAIRYPSSAIIPLTSGIRIHLHKAMPMGAGLGGGSSDGAFTITLLNQLLGLGLQVPQMEDFARMLGSDCAFFIANKPVLASGRGDQFAQCAVELSGFQIAVVKPDVHVATAGAYEMLTPKQPERPIGEIIALPVGSWKVDLVNDFEEPVFRKFPEIGEIKQKLYEAGAIYASMSGSGSAVYGIFNDKPRVEGLFPGCFTWLGTL